MKLTKLNEIYDSWETGDGVFTDLNALGVPWQAENIVTQLNMAYHGNHSGDKNVSPIVYKFLKSEDTGTRAKLANVIFTMFADKWAKLWNALQIEYNPINNYNMVENETTNEIVDGDETHTGTDTSAKTGTETTTATGTDTVANSGTDRTTHTGTDTTEHVGTNENEVSAFNSSSYQDNEKNSIDTTDTETINTTDSTTHGKTETETRNMTDTVTHNTTDTVTHNTADTNDETRDITRELTRSGNIGVTTTQQMLQSEIELRKWLYYQSVFNDIDTILTLSIY